MEKYCVNCGKVISQEAEFCKYCGSAQSAKGAAARPERKISTTKNSEADLKRKSGKRRTSTVGIIIIAIATIGIISACVFGAMWIRQKLEDKSYTTNSQTTEQTQEEAKEMDKTGEKQEPENTETNNTSDKDGNKSSEEKSKFKVGETYTVTADPNLRVRKDPNKDSKILDRSELESDYFKQSVESDETTDALLEKGSKVVCLEMSGKWMKIQSNGWICTEDEGEILVK